MPVYEYQCLSCDLVYTALQTLHARPEETPCPHCRDRRSRRMFSPFATHSDGSGPSAPPAPARGGGGCAASGCGCG